MKLFYRFILFIITLLFMFASLTMAIYTFGFAASGFLPELIVTLYDRWEFGFVFVLFFIAGAWVLYPFFSGRSNGGSTIISSSELGEVDITLEALDNLVKAVAMRQEGIDEIVTELKAGESGLNIYIKGKVISGTVIPQLADNLQLKVKAYIEETTGVNVNEVKVLIKDIADSRKSRLE